jgi:hypothetical protein
MAARVSHAAFAVKTPEGEMRERSVDHISVDLLLYCMIAVLFLGLQEGVRAVGEDRVVAVGGEQLVLAALGLLVAHLDSAHDQPGGDGLALLAGEGGVGRFGDLGVGDPAAGLLVEDRPRVGDRRPGVLVDGGDGGFDLGVEFGGDREPGVVITAGGDHLGAVEGAVAAHQEGAGAAGLAGGTDGFADR